MNLGNHDQWIDLDSIVECYLVDVYENSTNSSANLMPQFTTDSYVSVVDNFTLNTFKVGDYLMAYPNISDALEEIGCWAPVMQITAISNYQLANGVATMQLSVRVPESPDDYIDDSDIVTNGTQLFNNSWTNINGSWSDIVDESELERRRLGWGSWTNPYITLSKTIGKTLLDLTFTKSLSKTWSVSKSWSSTGYKPKLSFSGDGSLTVEMGLELGVKVYFRLSFWHKRRLVSTGAGRTKLDASITADYGIHVWFGATLSGSVSVDITDIISFKKNVKFAVGVVPIWVKFYLTFDAALTTVPVSISAGVECRYGETARFGAKYNSDDSNESGIYAERQKWSNNGCTPKAQLSAVDTSDDTCPVTEYGFDVEVSTTFGAQVYSVIGPYIKVALDMPFRITMPEFEDDVCSSATSACANDDLWTSFTMAMYLKAYAGGDVVGYGTITETEFASATILSEQAIACVKLDDLSSTLNDFYQPICCATATPTPAPTFDSGMSAHMLVEGCSGTRYSDVDCPYDGKYPMCASNDATTEGDDNIAVQCCAMDGSSAARPGCVEGVTFDAAKSHCASNGMRLCTMDETLADLGTRTGCEFSDNHVWTSTPCSHIIYQGSLRSTVYLHFHAWIWTFEGELLPECAYDDATTNSTNDDIGVQCCAMDGSFAARPGCVQGVNFDDAESHCASNGMRLCTDLELFSDIGKLTGCGFSDHHVWTSTSCSQYNFGHDFGTTNAPTPPPTPPTITWPPTSANVVVISWYWIAGLAVPVLALCVLNVCFRILSWRRRAKYAAVHFDSDQSDVDSAGEAEPMKVAVAE